MKFLFLYILKKKNDLMLRNYSDYINYTIIKEASEPSPTEIYWDRQVEELLDRDWENISTNLYAQTIKIIKFRAGSGKYDYYSVLFEKSGDNDEYFLQNSDKFIKKFTIEFWKNAQEYVKNFKFEPKCLGDLSSVKNTEKYNI